MAHLTNLMLYPLTHEKSAFLFSRDRALERSVLPIGEVAEISASIESSCGVAVATVIVARRAMKRENILGGWWFICSLVDDDDS